MYIRKILLYNQDGRCSALAHPLCSLGRARDHCEHCDHYVHLNIRPVGWLQYSPVNMALATHA